MTRRKEVKSNKSHRRPARSLATASPSKHFLKIIVPSTIQDKKLRIPNYIVSKYADELSAAANLIVPSGLAWKVGLTKARDNIWFDKGWDEFVEHHSIGNGYSLVFRYMGFSKFNVLIFDVSFCEIEYPCNGAKCSVHAEDVMEADDDDSIEILHSTSAISSPSDCSKGEKRFDARANNGESSRRVTRSAQHNLESNKHRKKVVSKDSWVKRPMVKEQVERTDYNGNESKSRKLEKPGMSNPSNVVKTEFDPLSSGENQSLPKCEEGIESISSEMFTSGLRRASETHGSDKAIHAARMFKPKNPSFLILLRPYNFYNNNVVVPVGFAVKYLSGDSKFIRLQVSDGREWPIRVSRRECGRLTLGRGWSEFHRENRLKRGDVCVFELIKKNVLLKVSIFHAAAADVQLVNRSGESGQSK